MCQKIFGFDNSKPVQQPIKQSLCQLFYAPNYRFGCFHDGKFRVEEPQNGRMGPVKDGNFAGGDVGDCRLANSCRCAPTKKNPTCGGGAVSKWPQGRVGSEVGSFRGFVPQAALRAGAMPSCCNAKKASCKARSLGWLARPWAAAVMARSFSLLQRNTRTHCPQVVAGVA